MIAIFTRADLKAKHQELPLQQVKREHFPKRYSDLFLSADKILVCDGASVVCLKDRGTICKSICDTRCQFGFNRFPFRLSSLSILAAAALAFFSVLNAAIGTYSV